MSCERIQESYGSDQVEIFENDIELFLHQFCEEQGIKSMKEESQAVWNAALMYIRRHAFNDKGKLKQKSNLDGTKSIMKSNFNAYNYDIVSSVCDYYIYICMKYDKEVSLMGFSCLTGINIDTLIDWGHGSTALSNQSCEIYEKLRRFREESLSAKLATAKRNPVGILAILNRHYQWNMPGVSHEKAPDKALTSSELPTLVDSKVVQSAQKELIWDSPKATEPQDIVYGIGNHKM